MPRSASSCGKPRICCTPVATATLYSPRFCRSFISRRFDHVVDVFNLKAEGDNPPSFAAMLAVGDV